MKMREIEDMKRLNDEIKTTSNNIAVQLFSLNEISDLLKLNEAKILLEISKELDDSNNKLKYSNDTMRQSELIIRLSSDIENDRLKMRYKDKKLVLSVLKEEMRYKLREFDINKLIIKLKVGDGEDGE